MSNKDKWWPILQAIDAQEGKHEWLCDYCEHHARIESRLFNVQESAVSTLPISIKLGMLIDTSMCDIKLISRSMTPHQIKQVVSSDPIPHEPEYVLELVKSCEKQLISDAADYINGLLRRHVERGEGLPVITLGLLVSRVEAVCEGTAGPVNIVLNVNFKLN